MIKLLRGTVVISVLIFFVGVSAGILALGLLVLLVVVLFVVVMIFVVVVLCVVVFVEEVTVRGER